MSNFRLFMWMLFVITLLGVGLIVVGGVMGDASVVNAGGGILFGTGTMVFMILLYHAG